MAIRHRRPPRFGRKTRRTLIGCALLAVLLPLTGAALRAVIDRTQDCGETLGVQVAAAPAIASALADIAGRLAPGTLRVGSACVSVTVTEMDSAAAATALVAERGASLDVGGAAGSGAAAGGEAVAHVWVPESQAWTLRVQGAVEGTGGALISTHVTSVARSPVGLAVPADDAEAIGALNLDTWNPDDLTIGLPDPRADAAGLAALATIDNVGRAQEAVVHEDLTAAEIVEKGEAAPMSELDVAAYNAEHPDAPVALLPTEPSITGLDFPYAMRADLSGQMSTAAEKFMAILDDDAYLPILLEAGLAAPDEFEPTLTTAAVAAALRAWAG